jgi:hypothetical protein
MLGGHIGNALHGTLKAYGGDIVPQIWVAACPSSFIPGGRVPCTHCIGDWMPRRVWLDIEEQEMYE